VLIESLPMGWAKGGELESLCHTSSWPLEHPTAKTIACTFESQRWPCPLHYSHG